MGERDHEIERMDHELGSVHINCTLYNEIVDD
jgi:hypothetical protein